MKVASFFAGIGGFDYGFERAGMVVVWQSELNHFRQRVLKKNFPNSEIYGDIAQISPDDIPDVDLWCGGFPCQDLSLANQGKRKGLKGERSGLFFEFYRLLKVNRPRWVVLENVPGLLNSHSGEDFRVLISAMDECGYGVAWRILDAKYFGTPQRRRRVFVVASLGSMRAGEVLFEHKGVKVTAKSGVGAKETLTPGFRGGDKRANTFAIQHAGINRKHDAGPQAKGYRNDGETYTLDSRGSADAVCKTNDAFRVREVAGFSRKLDSNRYRAVGDAVCTQVTEWIGRRIALLET